MSGVSLRKRISVWLRSRWVFRFVRCADCGKAHVWPGYLWLYQREQMGQVVRPCGHGTYREMRSDAMNRRRLVQEQE